jgi:hypothetical protein
MKNLLRLTTAGALMLAGACIASGLLNHISSTESIILTIVSLLLSAFGLLEINSMEDY